MAHRRGSSERHSALDRMRERRAMRGGPEEEEWPAPPPRRPPRMKGEAPVEADRGPASPPARPDSGGRAPRIPQSPRRTDPTRDKAEERRKTADRRAQRQSEEDGPGESPRRERGPRGDSEPARKGGRSARASADPADDEDPLPAGVKKADFKTLQEFISKEIQDSESVAGTFEREVRDDETELRRHREVVRKRREESERAREEERERARQQRRRAQEQARKHCEAEMRREEEAEMQGRRTQQQNEEQIKREFAAVTRLQALVRGRRSRRGVQIESPALKVKAKPHARPMSPALTAAPSCHSTPRHLELLA